MEINHSALEERDDPRARPALGKALKGATPSVPCLAIEQTGEASNDFESFCTGSCPAVCGIGLSPSAPSPAGPPDRAPTPI
jgi:hypothetical protein